MGVWGNAIPDAQLLDNNGGMTRRDFLKCGAVWLSVLAGQNAHAEDGNDPVLSHRQVERWFYHGADALPIRQGNQVTFLFPGAPAFANMVQAIRTARTNQHYIYLAAWWLTDSFPMIPGNPATTIQRLFTRASHNHVQVRAMLWDQLGNQNSTEVDHINQLAGGAAILDNRTLTWGSHHQKVLVVGGSDGLIAFCGGMDINPDRLFPRGEGANKNGTIDGAPLWDVHCRIQGPAAGDVLNAFVERWHDHPDHAALDRSKGTLRGAPVRVPPAVRGATNWVQIGRTYGNGRRHAGLGNPPRYAFAPNGEQTAAHMILHAIRQAERFIYVEDQYFVDTAPNAAHLDVRAALAAALRKPHFQHLTVLTSHPSINNSMPERNYRRKQLIQALRQAGGNKVRVFALAPPGDPHTYVHSKLWIFDDEYAIIGSANCCRRSFTHDSELVAGICDQGDGRSLRFPHRLRMALWARHLNVPQNRVRDPMAAARLWRHPPDGAHITPYNVNQAIEPFHPDGPWNAIIDPDGS